MDFIGKASKSFRCQMALRRASKPPLHMFVSLDPDRAVSEGAISSLGRIRADRCIRGMLR